MTLYISPKKGAAREVKITRLRQYQNTIDFDKEDGTQEEIDLMTVAWYTVLND